MASDLIYREDAKDFVRHAYRKGLNPVEYIDEIPAADVRPVARGHWERLLWFVTCSVCEYTTADTDDEGDDLTTLLVDTREQWTQLRPGRRPDTHISDYLERHGIPWKMQKLDVGDYMLEGGSVTVDRKKDLEEVASNLLNPADRARFWNEVRLAYRLGIKLVVLVEDSANQSKEAIRGWKSSYSPANGAALLRQMERLKYSYGVLFYVCHKRSTGRRIMHLLSGKDDEKWKPVI